VSPIAGISKFGELAIILWLLIKGVKQHPDFERRETRE
jgi:hypothetical protein